MLKYNLSLSIYMQHMSQKSLYFNWGVNYIQNVLLPTHMRLIGWDDFKPRLYVLYVRIG